MADVKAYDIAGMFLRRIGGKDTPAMRRAVAIWLRFESGGTVVGNNPWNAHSGPRCPKERGYCPGYGDLPGQIGNRYAGPGDQNVAVFRTLQDGVNVSADRLMASWGVQYGYHHVVREARQGDALGFLSALQRSSWSAGHYGYSKLVNAFNSSLGYNYTIVLRNVGGGTTGPVDGGTPGGGGSIDLPNVDEFISIPEGKILTEADIEYIIGRLMTIDIVKADPALGLLIQNILRDKLKQFVGKPWNKTTQNEMQAVIFAAAEEAKIKTPLDGVIEGATSVLGFLLDPENWLYIFALLAGIGLAGYGFGKLVGVQMPRIPVPNVAEESA